MRTVKIGVVLFLLLLALGCQSTDNRQSTANSSKTPPPKTPLSKEVLTERLGKKGVMVKPPRTEEDIFKPNPLVLVIEFDGSTDRFKLNRESYASFPDLLKILEKVRLDREKNGVYREGTNDIEMTLTLSVPKRKIEEYKSAGIVVEDFEKLVDELGNEGFRRIELSFGDELDPAEPPTLGDKSP